MDTSTSSLFSSPQPVPLADRHNVGRVPELDYFVRKLNGTEAWWGKQFPYTKAGEAKPIPNCLGTPTEYISQMQAHTALEFQVSQGPMPRLRAPSLVLYTGFKAVL